MKYIRTKDGITTSDKATHELIENICCAGYLRTLEKGANVRIGKQWTNFYGHWVDIIDENGCHYSIRPDEVERVTKELPQADTIEELCDEFIVVHENGNVVIQKKVGTGLKDMDKDYPEYLERNNQVFYGAIWTEWGLKYVAKMNKKGELELL